MVQFRQNRRSDISPLSVAKFLCDKQYPYFRAMAHSLVWAKAAVDSVVLAENGVVLYNEEWLGSLPPAKAAAIVASVISGALRGYASQTAAIAASNSDDSKIIAEVSTAIATNDSLRHADKSLVDVSDNDMFPTPDKLAAKHFGVRGLMAKAMDDWEPPVLPNDQGWDEYYRQINFPEPPEGEGGEGDSNGDDGNDDQSSSGSSGGGQQQDDQQGDGQDPDGQQSPRSGLPISGSGVGNPQDIERQIPKGMGRSQAQMAAAREATAAAIQAAAAKDPGDVPLGLKMWADMLRKPPQVRWQTELQREVRRGVIYAAGGSDYKYGRPPRRQSAYGNVIMPRLVRPIPNIWVVLDTSGSMTMGTEIPDSIVEIAGLLRAMNGAHITFLSGDCEVHEVTKATKIRDVLKHISGGGGTDFRPPFALAQKVRPSARPDILVYCTDGCGPAPERPIPGLHTIWCLVGRHAETPASWGKVIKIKPNA